MENILIVSPQKAKAGDLDVIEVAWRKLDKQDYSKSPFCEKCHRKDFLKGKAGLREEYTKMDFIGDNEDQELRKGVPVSVTFTRMWKCPYCFSSKAIVIPIKEYIELEGGKK